jgi:hypothetical protein
MRRNMRREWVLGVGLAALVGGTASAQFASDRAPAGAPAPVAGGLTPVVGGFQPLSPPVAPVPPGAPNSSLYTPMYSAPAGRGAYVPPSDAPRAAGAGVPAPAALPNLAALPATVEIPTVLPKDHPWLLKPEHGAYFIIVKSYMRPARDSQAAREEGDKWVSARELAEGLAREIRETHNVQAFLYEYISDERKAEMRAYLLARQKAETEYLAQVRAMEQKAQLQGFAWEPPDNKLRIRMYEHSDQIGVLIGGFQTEADALRAVTVLKTWAMPKNTKLLELGHYTNRDKNGKVLADVSAYVNPYESASVVSVVRNPAITKAAQPTAVRTGVDPFIVELNKGCEYNLLKATKGWTLGVKSFTVPVEIAGRDKAPDLSVMKKGNAPPSKTPELLVATAQQAEALAKALRTMKGPRGESLNLEAFVLHTRSASIVTVGQFDGPDDPALLATKRIIEGLSAQTRVTEDQTGMRPAMNAPRLFDNPLPIPIPKPEK